MTIYLKSDLNRQRATDTASRWTWSFEATCGTAFNVKTRKGDQFTISLILPAAVEKVASPPSSAENTNVWIVIGVVVPLLVVFIILSVLYWKLCRTDKLEFQPDAMTSIQQRQKVESIMM